MLDREIMRIDRSKPVVDACEAASAKDPGFFRSCVDEACMTQACDSLN